MFNTTLHKIMESIDENAFIIGDNHWFHDNVKKYNPTRAEAMARDGFEDMNEWMIHLWNSVVGEEDVVLHIGDFAYKGIPELKGRLNGRKFLILGNHDKKGPNTYHGIFDYVFRGHYVHTEKRTMVSHCDDDLFSTIVKTINGKKLLITHYPATEGEKKWYVGKNPKMVARLDEIMDIAKEYRVDCCVHGHTHERDVVDERVDYGFINCSMERLDFRPKRIKEILKSQF